MDVSVQVRKSKSKNLSYSACGFEMKVKRYIVLLVSVVISLVAMATTPEQTLQSCVAKLQGAKSLKAEFSMTAQGHTVSGTLISKGKKFAVTSSASGTWYDGHDMWVYTPSSGEVTVWKPVASELSESNPLLYLSTSSDYTVKDGGKSSKGENVLVLTPKKRNTGVKSIRVCVNAATKLPASLDITTGSGNVKIVVKNLQLNVSASDGAFTFPKSKYPKARITDLR